MDLHSCPIGAFRVCGLIHRILGGCSLFDPGPRAQVKAGQNVSRPIALAGNVRRSCLSISGHRLSVDDSRNSVRRAVGAESVGPGMDERPQDSVVVLHMADLFVTDSLSPDLRM